MPPVSNKAMLTDSVKQTTSTGGCELCDANITVPLTVHLRMAHPGCGGDCMGYGYNSNGKFTTGWSGECGAGGRGQSPWYLMCNNCRTQYLKKTPAGHHQERTRRWREFRFSTSASDARPEVIIRHNALFLLDLNCRLQTESNVSSVSLGVTQSFIPELLCCHIRLDHQPLPNPPQHSINNAKESEQEAGCPPDTLRSCQLLHETRLLIGPRPESQLHNVASRELCRSDCLFEPSSHCCH